MTTPLELDLDALEAAAQAATPGPEHIYTHQRDSNNCQANEWYHHNLYPQYVLELIGQLRAAEIELAGANERAQLLLDAKNKWMDRAVAAEAIAAARVEQIPTDAKMIGVFADIMPEHRAQAEELAEAIKKRCTSGRWTLVAFFPAGADIKTLDEDVMRAAGWVRAERGGE